MDIYLFLKGFGTDDRGRTLQSIWDFDDQTIDTCHNFIQKIFPTNEQSTHSLNTFFIDSNELIDHIRIDPRAAKNLLISKDWFLAYLSRNNSWQYGYNHNQLRVTRVIKSLLLLVSRVEAQLFCSSVHELIKADSNIPAITYDYWMAALGNDLAQQAR